MDEKSTRSKEAGRVGETFAQQWTNQGWRRRNLEVGLSMNLPKTKIMQNQIGATNSNTSQTIKINNNLIKMPNNYIYLVNTQHLMMPQKKQEVKRRITLGWQSLEIKGFLLS
jgi:hypothetical protein